MPHENSMTPANDNMPHSIRPMLGMKQVLVLVPFSRATLYREMNANRFPQAREIAPRRIAWFKDEVEAWQKALDNPRVA